MITAIVLVRAARDQIPQTAERLAAIPHVAECYSVTGDWDIACILRFAQFEDLDDIVTQGLRGISGIERTQTMLAFKTYPKELLDQGFGIGMDESGV